MKKHMPEIFISAAQLAQRWSISVSAVYMYRGGTERLTRHRLGRVIRFSISEIEEVETAILAGNLRRKNNGK
jgi:predicted DNA-binding transcriptional regulator AlpA